jgi:hypothetical protein
LADLLDVQVGNSAKEKEVKKKQERKRKFGRGM